MIRTLLVALVLLLLPANVDFGYVFENDTYSTAAMHYFDYQY